MAEFTGARWGMTGAGTAATVTWSFGERHYTQLSSGFFGYDPFDAPVAATYRDTIRSAFAAWEAVCGIDFVEVGDSAASDIRIGNDYIDGYARPGQSTTLAVAQWWTSGGLLTKAQISFDVDAYDQGYVYQTTVHEIGHAIGLAHSSNASSTMYFAQNQQNRAGQLDPDDIAGAQALYGAKATSVPQGTVLAVEVAYRNILRTDLDDAQAGAVARQIDGKSLSITGYVDSLVTQARSSTIPALILYDEIFGRTPDAARLDSLATFAGEQARSANYMATRDPRLGAYEALGLGFSGTAEFQAKYSEADDAALVSETYSAALGRAASDAQVAHFVNQLAYFEGLYIRSGLGLAASEIRARGAVVGQIFGHAAAEAGNLHASGATAFLYDAADGNVVYGAALKGLAASQGQGVSIIGLAADEAFVSI